jgi:hypothetical protein
MAATVIGSSPTFADGLRDHANGSSIVLFHYDRLRYGFHTPSMATDEYTRGVPMRRCILIYSLVTALPMSAFAQDGAFDRGSISASVDLGYATYATGGSYFILGGGVGYFVWDGVEVSFDVEHWFGSDALADITKVRPGVRYVVWQTRLIHPYLGVFYRHWFIHSDLFDDADTIGARVGAIYAPGRLQIGIGAMYEFILTECTTCGAWSPEISLGVTF